MSTDLNWDLEDSFTALKQDQAEMLVCGDDLIAKASLEQYFVFFNLNMNLTL